MRVCVPAVVLVPDNAPKQPFPPPLPRPTLLTHLASLPMLRSTLAHGLLLCVRHLTVQPRQLGQPSALWEVWKRLWNLSF